MLESQLLRFLGRGRMKTGHRKFQQTRAVMSDLDGLELAQGGLTLASETVQTLIYCVRFGASELARRTLGSIQCKKTLEFWGGGRGAGKDRMDSKIKAMVRCETEREHDLR